LKSEIEGGSTGFDELEDWKRQRQSSLEWYSTRVTH